MTTTQELDAKKEANKIPERLPQGVTEFNEWANDILDFYGLPNNDSTHFSLAAAILHVKDGLAYVPKEYFANVLLRGAANQVAHHIMVECKERQQKLIEEEKKAAEAAAQQVEVTTSPDAVTSNVDPK